MRQAAAVGSCLAFLAVVFPACGAPPRSASGPAPAVNSGPGGSLEYDGKTTRLGNVRCWASSVSPAVRLYFTDTPIPADVAKSLEQTEAFLSEKRVTQVRLLIATAENPPRIVEGHIQDYKSKINSGIERLLADQPPYVFDKAVADDAHIAGHLVAKGAKTDPNQIPHSFDLQFDIPRSSCP